MATPAADSGTPPEQTIVPPVKKVYKVAKTFPKVTEQIVGKSFVPAGRGKQPYDQWVIGTPANEIWVRELPPADAETITYTPVLMEGEGDRIFKNNIMYGKYNAMQLQDAKLKMVRELDFKNALSF